MFLDVFPLSKPAEKEAERSLASRSGAALLPNSESPGSFNRSYSKVGTSGFGAWLNVRALGRDE